MDYKVFKFGGASIKNAKALISVKNILDDYIDSKYMVIVSAMGKTTNDLEALNNAHIEGLKEKYKLFNKIKDFHLEIANELSINIDILSKRIDELLKIIDKKPLQNHAANYATIVSFGEIFSTTIIFTYLDSLKYNISMQYAGDYIITDDNYKVGNVIWDKSLEMINTKLLPLFNDYDIILTQGFIAAAYDGFPSTLGREGSDYSASIFAYAIGAKDLTIWKDVPGLLNADPKFFRETQKLDVISYKETIELAYYGASIIHPRTIQPLQNKKIPLYIKSFLEPYKEGTIIQEKTYAAPIPSYIFKKNQLLISISARDFSFIAEESLQEIFRTINKFGYKVNMMQNSAISFSICIDDGIHKIKSFIDALQVKFNVKYNDGMELITIQHYNNEIINSLTAGREVFLEQKSRTCVQLLVR